MRDLKKFNFNNYWKKEIILELIYLKKISLISIDVFDTLLFRAVEKPTNIFNKVWEEAINKNLSNLELTPNEFSQLRIEAQKKAISNKKINHNTSEVNIFEIYNELPNIIENKEKLLEIELETEKKYCYPNPSILSLMKTAKNLEIQVVLLSDMYLLKEQIREILEFNGVTTDFYDTLIVSNEENKSKKNGDLFNTLKNFGEETEVSKIVHIGDNYQSDYESAIENGIKAIHYNVVPEKVNSIYFYEKIRHGILVEELLSLRKLSSNFNNFKDNDEKVAYEIGATLLGPFFSLFISWIVEQMENLNIKRIYPFMREGELLTQLIRNEFIEKNLDFEVKELYVSRKSTYLPSINKFDRENLEKVIISKNITVKDLFKLFELDGMPIEFEKISDVQLKEAYNVKFNSDQSVYEKIFEYFLRSDIREKINKNITEKRELFIEYLKQETDSDFMNIATIDIGFKGTIQVAIEDALINGEELFEITHFLAMGSEKIKERIMDGIKVRGFINNFSENLDLIRTILLSPDVLEQLILSPEGSTIDYQKINNKIKPIKSENILQNDKFKKACWKGIFDFQQLWFYFRKLKPDIAKNVLYKRRELMQILHRLIDMPTKEEAVVIGNLLYDDNFGSSHIEKLCSENHRRILISEGIDKIDEMKIYGYRHTGIPWPQGLITINDENYYLRKYAELNNNDEYLNVAREIVEKITKKNINNVVIYGAGEVGERLIKACQLYNINIINIVDRKQSLWGREIDGIEVISLDEAVKRCHTNYIVGSLAFIDEIKQTIISKFSNQNITPNIFTA